MDNNGSNNRNNRNNKNGMTLLIFVVAALITPPDIVSQIMVAIPMIGLYEISIIICTILMKFRKKEESEGDEADLEPLK